MFIHLLYTKSLISKPLKKRKAECKHRRKLVVHYACGPLISRRLEPHLGSALSVLSSKNVL